MLVRITTFSFRVFRAFRGKKTHRAELLLRVLSLLQCITTKTKDTKLFCIPLCETPCLRVSESPSLRGEGRGGGRAKQTENGLENPFPYTGWKTRALFVTTISFTNFKGKTIDCRPWSIGAVADFLSHSGRHRPGSPVAGLAEAGIVRDHRSRLQGNDLQSETD